MNPEGLGTEASNFNMSCGFDNARGSWLGLVIEQVSVDLARSFESALAVTLPSVGSTPALQQQPQGRTVVDINISSARVRTLCDVAVGGDSKSARASMWPSDQVTDNDAAIWPLQSNVFVAGVLDACAAFDASVTAVLRANFYAQNTVMSPVRVIPASWSDFEAKFLSRRPCSLSQLALQCGPASIDLPDASVVAVLSARLATVVRNVAFADAQLAAELVRDVLRGPLQVCLH